MSEVYENVEFEDIELVILQNALNNPAFSNTVSKLKPDFFTTTSRRNLYEIINSHIITYNEAPSFTILKQEVINRGVDEHSIKQIAKDLKYIQSGLETNIEWLKSQTEIWGKSRSGILGLNKARDIMNGHIS